MVQLRFSCQRRREHSQEKTALAGLPVWETVCGLDGGAPAETSLPSQTSSFVLGCARCQKGAVSVCSAQRGALESISISAASSRLRPPLTRTLCTDQHGGLKAKYIILSTDWIQMHTRTHTHTRAHMHACCCSPSLAPSCRFSQMAMRFIP